MRDGQLQILSQIKQIDIALVVDTCEETGIGGVPLDVVDEVIGVLERAY